MKNIIIFSLILILPIFVFSAMESGQQTKNRGLRVTPRNIEELKQVIESRRLGLENERIGMNELQSKVYENQNKLRSGAQNLMIMENMIGNQGLEVSLLAEEINNFSVNTLQYEEDFLKKSKLKKFLFGQSKEVSDQFMSNIEEREKRITKLNEIYNFCDCPPEVKEIFENQLVNIKEEQERIKMFFNLESKKKGVLSWLLKIFK